MRPTRKYVRHSRKASPRARTSHLAPAMRPSNDWILTVKPRLYINLVVIVAFVSMCCTGLAQKKNMVLEFDMPNYFGAREYFRDHPNNQIGFTDRWRRSPTWEIAPFNNLCISIGCIDKAIAKSATHEGSVRHQYFNRPYPPLTNLGPTEVVSELRRTTAWTKTDDEYIQAFVPAEYVQALNERSYSDFRLLLGDYLYSTWEVRIPPHVPDGLAICKSRARPAGAAGVGIPTNCGLVAIFREKERLYRVLIAKRNPKGSEASADRDPAFGEIHLPDEMNLESSRSQWNSPPTTNLSIRRSCFKRFGETLFEKMVADPQMLLPRQEFRLRTSLESIRISGTIPERESLVDNTFWEFLGVDITLDREKGDEYRPEITLFGYIGKQRGASHPADDAYYTVYFHRIVKLLQETPSGAC